jgi:hypothetical protein
MCRHLISERQLSELGVVGGGGIGGGIEGFFMTPEMEMLRAMVEESHYVFNVSFLNLVGDGFDELEGGEYDAPLPPVHIHTMINAILGDGDPLPYGGRALHANGFEVYGRGETRGDNPGNGSNTENTENAVNAVNTENDENMENAENTEDVSFFNDENDVEALEMSDFSFLRRTYNTDIEELE